jgi:WD40 repeat protein
MAVHPTGKLCLTAGNDKKMKLWDLHSGNCVSTMPLEHGKYYKILYILYLSDSRLIYCGLDPDLVMWSPAGETFAVLVNQQVLIYSAKVRIYNMVLL